MPFGFRSSYLRVPQCVTNFENRARVTRPNNNSGTMGFLNCRSFAVALCAVLLFVLPSTGVFAQSNDKQTPEQQKAAAEAAKESQKKIDEIAEAGRVVSGPAGNPECVWLGRRVVSLLWRDDLDTAFRHLDLYDRFGCPGGHVQQTFRCLVRQGNIDPKATGDLNSRVHACWLNPGLPPSPAAAQAAPPPPAEGTTPR